MLVGDRHQQRIERTKLSASEAPPRAGLPDVEAAELIDQKFGEDGPVGDVAVQQVAERDALSGGAPRLAEESDRDRWRVSPQRSIASMP